MSTINLKLFLNTQKEPGFVCLTLSVDLIFIKEVPVFSQHPRMIYKFILLPFFKSYNVLLVSFSALFIAVYAVVLIVVRQVISICLNKVSIVGLIDINIKCSYGLSALTHSIGDKVLK